MYFQPLHMFRQMNCHPLGVFIKGLQELTASSYTILYCMWFHNRSIDTCHNLKCTDAQHNKTKN
jgi:hypothetical protein